MLPSYEKAPTRSLLPPSLLKLLLTQHEWPYAGLRVFQFYIYLAIIAPGAAHEIAPAGAEARVAIRCTAAEGAVLGLHVHGVGKRGRRAYTKKDLPT
jgi:hypothetical protein